MLFSENRDTLIDGPRAFVRDVHRSGPRIGCSIDVRLTRGTDFFAGISTNVSEGGVFVATHGELEIGAELSLELTVSTGRVYARGVVLWQRGASPYGPPGLGVAFMRLSQEAANTLHAFCMECAPLYFQDDHL
ncbi:MAG: PilZ domain-containing protein [Polyangiaceae bacterium]